MKKPLVSFEEYEFFLNSGRPYWGYVWTKEGKIYEVEENLVTVVSSKPAWPHKSYGDSHRTVFFDTLKHPQISLLTLGSNDVLYNESGEFVSVIEANDTVKGEIKILKSKVNFDLPDSLWDEKWKNYEIVNLKDVTLSAEAYSKIFTHILSLEMKDKLETVRDKSVAVEIWQYDKVIECVHLAKNETSNGKGEAYFRQVGRIIAAVISNNNSYMYETVWNVINVLGAHELSAHGDHDWWDDRHRTHHLAYLYQMGHPSWEKTTPKFKKEIKDKLNNYYGDYWKEEYEYKRGISRPYPVEEHFNSLRSLGVYPKWEISSGDSIKFNDRLSRELQKKVNWRNPFNEEKTY